ncbi:MAG: hypothetical protein ACI9IP_001566 [Arcticibacterium sp.]|jgi:hypothetical protein
MDYFHSPKRTFSAFLGDIFFVVFLLLFNSDAWAQAYHYFNIEIAKNQEQTLNYFIFLGLESDGTASVRLKYIDSFSGDQKLVSQSYADTASFVNADSLLTRYLTASEDPLYLEGIEDSSLVQTRFLFAKKNENGEVFYEPSGIEFLGKSNNWQKAKIRDTQAYTFQDLLLKRNFVQIFYQDGDPFLEYLSISNSRGSNNSSLSREELKSKIYLIAVANTLDESIGSSSKKDLDKVTSMFTTLADKMGIPFSSSIVSGSDFSKINVKRKIRRLSSNSSDIIIFYYSGHGFRFDEDVSKYPRMSLRMNRETQPLNRHNLEIDEVATLLKSKGAKVTIVISDCCNESVGSVNPIGIDVIRPRGTSSDVKLNVANCRKLFYPQGPVSIVVGSAESGQLAAGNPSLGGFFTNFFVSNLTKSLYSTNGASSWIKLLADTRERTRRQALTALCGNARCIQRAELSVVPPL